jgi:hypothetical protein
MKNPQRLAARGFEDSLASSLASSAALILLPVTLMSFLRVLHGWHSGLLRDC